MAAPEKPNQVQKCTVTTDDDHTIHDRIGEPDASAVPPALTFVGALADLTQKQVGAGDGTTFLGVDIGG